MSTTTSRLSRSNLGRHITSWLTLFATISSAVSSTSPARSRKILVVDGDPLILKTMSPKPKSHGYDAVTAMDASEAIAAVRDQESNLVILDLSFPQGIANGGRGAWEGVQLMSWLRGLGKIGNIPLIITGGDPVEYKQRSLANGAMAFFLKPIDHDDLLPVVHRALVSNPGLSEGPQTGDSGNSPVCTGQRCCGTLSGNPVPKIGSARTTLPSRCPVAGQRTLGGGRIRTKTQEHRPSVQAANSSTRRFYQETTAKSGRLAQILRNLAM